MKEWKEIEDDIQKLSQYMRMYHVGYYPAFYFTINHGIVANDIFSMRLEQFYQINTTSMDIQVKKQVQIGCRVLALSEEDRITLSWYVLQRIPVKLQDPNLEQYICVNRDNKMVQAPSYRKTLNRASVELNLKHNYTTNFLKAVYAYREILLGRKTISQVAELYHCSRLHLINHTLSLFTLVYDNEMIQSMASLQEEPKSDVHFL